MRPARSSTNPCGKDRAIGHTLLLCIDTYWGSCGQRSAVIHRKYKRHPKELPWAQHLHIIELNMGTRTSHEQEPESGEMDLKRSLQVEGPIVALGVLIVIVALLSLTSLG